MGELYGGYGRQTNMYTGFWWGNLKERDYLEDLSGVWKTMKWVLRNRVDGIRLSLLVLEYGFCQHDNGSSQHPHECQTAKCLRLKHDSSPLLCVYATFSNPHWADVRDGTANREDPTMISMLHILCVIIIIIIIIILAFFSVSPSFVLKTVYTNCSKCLVYWRICALFYTFSFRKFLTADCPKLYTILRVC